ncbi:MAG TPA: amidohydrolase family protein [Longimicrobiales bacterium]|nr:amidohydrolase family protein [Longimicrobiales bacterium]
MKRVWAVVAAGVLFASGCTAPEEGMADLVFRGGAVWTGDPAAPSATAVAVKDGRILAVGTDAEVEELVGDSTRVVDLAGRMLMPGFIDSHTHFLDGGFKLAGVDLRDASTPEEFARRIGEFAKTVPAGTWITGGDWDHELWGGELPRKEWVDSVTPDHPVFVNRLDGHMSLANSVALRLAGVDAQGRMADPEGGTIVRDARTGAPAGVFKDEAMGIVGRAIPEPSEADLDRALQAAARHALERGVTQIHDMAGWDNLETYRRAHARGELPLRVYSVVQLSTWERLRDFVAANGRGDDRLWWGGLKAFVDGSLGSTTAWFHEPYDDEPGTSGLMVTDSAELRTMIEAGDAAGLQILVHAIGDAANDWLLGVYGDVAAAHGPRDRRFRIEHAQHLSPAALSRFAEIGVIAAMQPYHAADDGRWAQKRIGPERIKTTYAFRSLLDAGATLAFGSDWTVAPIDPILGLDAAVTRRTFDGANPEGWVPEQKITVDETLRAYTEGGAKAGFMEDRVGRIATGMLADLVILDRDVTRQDPKTLGDTRVDMTVVDGQVAYERPTG